MKDKNSVANQVLADMMFFDYLKEKLGERKTKTGAYCDLLEKASAGFVAPFLKNHGYVLQAGQCHVTITDLATGWHWHRATVWAFLDRLEEMGYISRTRLAKSVVITVAFAPDNIGEAPGSCTGQAEPCPADELDAALSEWITGNLSDEDIGDICGQYHASRLNEIAGRSLAGSSGSRMPSKDESADELTRTLVQRVAVAGLKRAIRNSRSDDPSSFMDFFNHELGGDWPSLFAAARMVAKMVLSGEDEAADLPSHERKTLLTLREPFKALLAKYQERDSTLLWTPQPVL